MDPARVQGMNSESNRYARLRREAGRIVRLGGSVRFALRNAVAAEAGAIAFAGGNLAALIRAALHGAADAVDNGGAPPEAFQQVIEGAGDGLVAVSQALQLAVREAAAHSSTFARGELDGAAEEFGKLASIFVDSVAEGLQSSSEHAEVVVSGLREQAAVVLRRTWPAFAAAAATARQDLVELGSSTMKPGAATLVESSGALRRELAVQLRTFGVVVQVDTDDAR